MKYSAEVPSGTHRGNNKGVQVHCTVKKTSRYMEGYTYIYMYVFSKKGIS